jgi:uncharacterized protein
MPTPMDPRTLLAWEAALTSWDAWLLTFALVVVVPVGGYLRFRRLQCRIDSAVSARTKLRLYATTICMQWILVGAMLLVAGRHGLSAADAGERLGSARLTFAVTLGLLAILAVVAAILLPRVWRAKPETLAAALGRMRGLAPTLSWEMVAFALVCLTAGVCEELLYRGWLVNLLRVATGSVWIAVSVGSVAFGLGHAYQGVRGMLRTGFIGLQLAVLYIAIGSLVPGQVLHAAVDLVGGFAMAVAAARLAAVEAAGAAAAPGTAGSNTGTSL